MVNGEDQQIIQSMGQIWPTGCSWKLPLERSWAHSFTQGVGWFPALVQRWLVVRDHTAPNP